MYTTLFSMINKSRCMAIIICFCSTCCDWIYSQSFKPAMLTQGSSWTYVRISETGGWTRSSCVERWSVDGDTTINQRHYDFLTVEYAFIDGDVQVKIKNKKKINEGIANNRNLQFNAVIKDQLFI